MPHPERTYRMYFFVPYNLSPIQQGIQAGHAAIEYAYKYSKNQEFKDFAFWDKTWIILNGGTSNDGHLGNPKGSMEETYRSLYHSGIPCANFYEPDINNAMTAICFLADDRVWDKEQYPDFIDYIINIKMRDDAKESIPLENYFALKIKELDERKKMFPEYYKEWVEFIGGEKNVFLRELISDKKLA